MEIFNVLWNRYDEEEKYIIGYLLYENKWYFKYNKDTINLAIQKGFRPFPEMPSPEVMYESESLFKTFDSRLRQKDSDSKLEIMKNEDSKLLTDNILVLYKKD